MQLNGFVAMRRGILDHAIEGRLSTLEFAVLTTLILLADKETGSGRINAPVLLSWLPDLSYATAKRILLSLQVKGYIFRDIEPHSKRMYRYWINHYVPSTGPHRSFQTRIEKALDSKDPRDVKYTELFHNLSHKVVHGIDHSSFHSLYPITTMTLIKRRKTITLLLVVKSAFQMPHLNNM